ncbi:translocation/assembly module TamB domain-containing protein [Natroniella sulfidigena]|uniref:translocation/assembly module TamB domain-containing protein n=1 Tax=Natroniella sulfidigena TaxID=723921 RepID=UPI00200B8B83|nr:translocation/assembly module TamB domain-containing protein [Natroniella sulfidigena]MCK8816377.1 translocation/assembly module TamB domain-containing protein [Natroniella sulfidigena]
MKLELRNSRLTIILGLLLLLVMMTVYSNINHLLLQAREEAINLLEQELATEIVVDDIKVRGINKISIAGLTVKDEDARDLLTVEEVTINYSLFDLILNRLDPLEGINDIGLVTPEVQLIEEEDWNYQFLIDQFEVPEEVEHSFPIEIEQGKVAYFDSQFEKEIENINGEITSGQQLSFDLHSNSGSKLVKELSLAGTFEAGNYHLELNFADLKLTNLTEDYDLDMLDEVEASGQAAGMLRLRGNMEGLSSYYGNLEVVDAIASNDQLTIDGIDGVLSFNKYGLRFEKLTGNYQDMPLELTGEIFSWEQPQLNLEFISNKIDLGEVSNLVGLDQVELEGLAQASGGINGSLDNPTIVSEFNLEEGQIEGVTLDGFKSEIYYKDQVLNFEELEFDLARGRVTGEGRVDFSKELDYIFTTKLANISLTSLEEELEVEFSSEGLINGETILSGSGIEAEDLNMLGSVAVDEGSIQDYDFNQFETSFWLNQGNFFLNQAELITDYSKYDLTGLVTLDGDLDLNLIADNVKLAELAGFHNQEELTGEVDLTGQVSGNLSEPQFRGDFRGSDLEYDFLELGEMNGGLILLDEGLQFKEVVLPEFSSSLSGGIDFQTGKSDIVLRTEGVELNEVLTATDIQLPFSGITTGKIKINSLFAPFKLAGEVIIEDGIAYEQGFDQAEIDFTYNDQEVIINDSKVNYQDSDLQILGSIEGEELDLQFKADNLSLSSIDYLPEDFDVSGQSALEGRVHGSIVAPQVAGIIEGSDIEIYGQQLGDLEGRVDYREPNLYLKDIAINDGDYRYQTHGVIDLNRQEFDDLIFEIQEGNLDHFTQFFAEEFALSHPVEGRVVANGSLLEPELELDLLFEEEGGVGYLQAKGDYWLQRDLDLELIAKEFDLRALDELELIDHQLAGRVNLTGNLTGSLDNLNLDSQVRVTDGQVSNLEYQRLAGRLRLIDSQKLILEQQLQLKEDNILQARGKVPLVEDEEFDLDLRVEEGNLSILSFWLEDIESAKGRGRGDLSIAGSWQDPKLNGNAEIVSGSFDHLELDREFNNLNGRIDFADKEVIVEQLTGYYGSGDFDLDGKILINGFMPKEYDLELTGEDIFFKHGSWEGLNQLDLQLAGDFEQPLITGEIIAYNTFFSLPVDWPVMEGEGQFNIEPQFDLVIKPGQDVRVGNNNIDILVQSGELFLESASQGIELTGQLESTTGRFTYYNTEFEVEEASANFGRYTFVPDLQLESNARIRGEEIELNLYGPADQLEFNLLAQDDLTEEEVINLLARQGGMGSLLERDFEEAIRSEMFRIIDEGIKTELIYRVERSFEKTLDLDQVRIRSLLSDEVEIKLGKFIFDNFMLKYNHTFGIEEEQAVGFEYQFSRGLENLRLDGNYNNYGDYQMGLEMSLPF